MMEFGREVQPVAVNLTPLGATDSRGRVECQGA
jgi:hypothetical protein